MLWLRCLTQTAKLIHIVAADGWQALQTLPRSQQEVQQMLAVAVHLFENIV